MKTLESILKGAELRSTMLSHEGGTKFYEVMTLHVGDKVLCMKRWGRNASKDKNGTFGKAKDLMPKFYSHYAQAAVNDKMGRGYSVENNFTCTGREMLDKLADYGFNDYLIDGDDGEIAADWFKSLGWDGNKVIGYEEGELMSDFSEEVDIPEVVAKQSVASSVFGSW